MPGRETLISPEDKPAPAEEAAIAKVAVRRTRALEDVEWRLRNSARRTVAYKQALEAAQTPEQITKAARDLEVERMAQERLMSERERAVR